MVKQEYNDPQIKTQEELVKKLWQQRDAHSAYPMGANYKKADKMYKKATQQLEKMKSNAKLVLNKATKEEVEKKSSRVDVSQNNIKEENGQKLSKVQEVQQESKSQSTPEKTTVQIYPPELEKQINEKKDELGKFIKKHDHTIKNLRAQHMELKYKDDEIKKVWPKFDKAKESVASFKQEAASLSDDLKKQRAALSKINQSFVKRLINIFTGEKGKLTNEISTLQQRLDVNKQKMKSQEGIVSSCKMNLETYKEETKEIVKKIVGLEQLNQISDQLKNIKKELPENIRPLLFSQIEKIEKAVNNSIKAANDTMTYGKNIIASTKIENDDKKKEMKVLTLEASDRSESLRSGKNRIDKNKEVSRA